ncbi:hypothetical protein [Micromonospora sediminicola]|uniref:hypothetical protein n=1 Tax=Micromonospora sediminicola TaxID=946078 RepID=UPI000A8E5BAE|nr:hypothetical protein [Micromonospora sediminicola]
MADEVLPVDQKHEILRQLLDVRAVGADNRRATQRTGRYTARDLADSAARTARNFVP